MNQQVSCPMDGNRHYSWTTLTTRHIISFESFFPLPPGVASSPARVLLREGNWDPPWVGSCRGNPSRSRPLPLCRISSAQSLLVSAGLLLTVPRGLETLMGLIRGNGRLTSFPVSRRSRHCICFQTLFHIFYLKYDGKSNPCKCILVRNTCHLFI